MRVWIERADRDDLVRTRWRAGRHDVFAVASATRIVARGCDHDRASRKWLLHPKHLQETVEQPQIRPVGFESDRRRELADPTLLEAHFDGRGEVEANGHRNDV